jgi:hypothetical protein
MTEWQPIETAPKDGTVVRLYIPDHPGLEGMEGRWNEYSCEWESYPRRVTLGQEWLVPDPTMWMPRKAAASGQDENQ